MNRKILTLRPPAPPAPEELPLPPRAPKGPSAEGRLLSFIVDDRKRHHHPTYVAAAQERDFLQAQAAQEKRGKRRPKFCVRKVLNVSGADLEGRVVVHAGKVNETALDVALEAYFTAAHSGVQPTGNERAAMRSALLAYLDFLAFLEAGGL